MAYSENGGVINTAGNITAGGYVTKKYLFEAYPQLSGQAKSAGLWGWGRNHVGQLGNNDGAASLQASPVQTISGGANWRSVDCGTFFTSAIKTDGTLWGWGSGVQGQLGTNSTTNQSSPVQTISGGTNWKLLSCGNYHTVAIKTDGTLWSWGRGAEGQMGDSTNAAKSSPVQTAAAGTNWKLIAGGGSFSAAIKTDGTLWLWGQNSYGQLGNGSTAGAGASSNSPRQEITAGTTWKQVSCGTMHTVAIKNNGTLWGWGANSTGQLGTNGTTNYSSPVQTISGGSDWKLVSGGHYHTAAIKTDGTLWLWGYNYYGQLGDNTAGNGTNKSSPVQTAAAGTNWRKVVAHRHTVAIKTDGTLWGWGDNQYGELGDNTSGISYRKSSPVQTVSAGTNWKDVAPGHDHTAAIKDFNEDF